MPGESSYDPATGRYGILERALAAVHPGWQPAFDVGSLRHAALVCLRTLAERRRRHVLGGEGVPLDDPQRTVARTVEQRLREGEVAVARAGDREGVAAAYASAAQSLAAPIALDVPTALWLHGAAHKLREGVTVPSVRASTPPFNAAVVDVRSTASPAEDVAVERVTLGRPEEMSAAWALDGAKVVLTLQWTVAAPAESMRIGVHGRVVSGAFSHAFIVPRPTAGAG